jgi:hypothetical protein
MQNEIMQDEINDKTKEFKLKIEKIEKIQKEKAKDSQELKAKLEKENQNLSQ